jgi:hypothetical protein
MHYLIPFAAVGSPGCAQAWDTLQLPHLTKLMQRMTMRSQDIGDEYSFSPPHERVLAQAWGLWTADGCTPWAAHDLSGNPADTGYHAGQAWAYITPCHWHVGTDQVQMSPPNSPQLDEEGSRAVLGAMRPYFAEDGIALHYGSPTRWYAQSKLFDGLATASLDRVVGRNVNTWMSEGAQAAPLRRLQNEMQMLLYTHPITERRQAAGQLAINSFWVSGAGALPGAPVLGHEMTVVDDLRAAALEEDWHSWSSAWQKLDNTLMKELEAKAWRGEPVKLVICGERMAQHWCSYTPSLGQRFLSLFDRQPNKILRDQL